MSRFKWFLHQRYRRSASVVHELTYLFWECTLRCNLHCKHCGSDCHKESGIPDMPAETFLNVCRTIAKKYNSRKIMVVLTGGEPTLRDDLEYIGRELKRLGFSWGIVSNSFLLTPSRIDSLHQAGMSSATVSLDGTSKYHDAFRGKKGSYDAVLQAVSKFNTLNNFVYDVVTVVNTENTDVLEGIYKSLLQEGVKRWRLFSTDPIGRARNMCAEEIGKGTLKHLMNFIMQKRILGQMHVTYGCEGYLGSYEGTVRDGYFFCRAGINIASVLANGDISACPNINRGFVQGNIYKNDFIQTWEKEFLEMRERSWMKSGKCTDCSHFERCLGNALHLREPNNDDPLRCHFEQIEKNS